MIYKNLSQAIPQERRADINAKVISLIDSSSTAVTKEELYNLYTGDGGLHGFNLKDFESFHAYSKAKQYVEQGQFFTSHDVAKRMIEILRPAENDFIADITCGSGVFFNFLNPNYCYGVELDLKAAKVAQYLYPEANIENKDVRFYHAPIKFDTIIGNPPFNLDWGKHKSQFIYMQKAAELLKPAGLFMFIVPETFLQDDFYYKSAIEEVEDDFNFICQYKLDPKDFRQVGVKYFETKVMVFQRKSEFLAPTKIVNTYVTDLEAFDIMTSINEVKKSVKAKVTLEIARSVSDNFTYKLRKYLFEIKQHKSINKKYVDALAYVEKFHSQKCPDTMSYDEWEKQHKITEKMVIGYLKRLIAKQSVRDIEKIAVVKDKYGYKLKAYSPKSQRLLNKENEAQVKSCKNYELINSTLPANFLNYLNKTENKAIRKHISKLNNSYAQQSRLISDMQPSNEIGAYLDRFTFISKGIVCNLSAIQKADMNKIIQKDYFVLNYQQGSGKTCCAFAYANYKKRKLTFIVSAALAINLTWKPFLESNNQKFVQINKLKDFDLIEEGSYVLLSLEYVSKYKKQLKQLVKNSRQNVTLIFDESDEITNNTSLRTKAVLDVFRRVKTKLLATGTTTRNNITEIYSQMELLYNNSYNMLSMSASIYKEVYTKEDGVTLKKVDNDYQYRPFPAYKGNLLFKRCFNPSKTTVFGVQKHNQDIYNAEDLKQLLEKTILTRKFKEIAGDKYKVHSIQVRQEEWEKLVYKKIIKEFYSICNGFFKSTGNARKDSMLRLLRQIDLLIRATSVPQIFDKNGGTPAKFKRIGKLISELDERVAIGTTSIEALNRYSNYITDMFPDRKLFVIQGDVSFKNRAKILEEFAESPNGILVSTQMSLKSSLNIPCCSKCIIESLQWNIPKIEQYYFRFIRFDSPSKVDVYFVNYENTIETNLMALLMAKERLNEYIKTLDFKDQEEMFDEYGIDTNILNNLMSKQKNEEGHIQLAWGDGSLV